MIVATTRLRRSLPAARHIRGFSLLEVLAAFVILALVATALFRLFSASLNNVSAAEDWSRALLIAESQLEMAASTQPLHALDERGIDESGKVRWISKVAPFTVPDIDQELERASDALSMRLYRISVDVTFDGADGKERTLSLATMRLGPRNPA
ncbi:MAG: prepilin-type N-terminal cleavage/methylation domain-containing protein [Betaproteobacteria bacterium]